MNCTGSFIILESWNEPATRRHAQVNGLFQLKANFFFSFTFFKFRSFRMCLNYLDFYSNTNRFMLASSV